VLGLSKVSQLIKGEKQIQARCLNLSMLGLSIIAQDHVGVGLHTQHQLRNTPMHLGNSWAQTWWSELIKIFWAFWGIFLCLLKEFLGPIKFWFISNPLIFYDIDTRRIVIFFL